MIAFIKTYASRIAAAAAAALVALLVQFGIEIGPEALAGLAAFLEAILIGAGLLAYGVIHKLIDKVLRREEEDVDND